MSFLGTFTHTIDSKGRLTIPLRLREDLDEGLILARGFDLCLTLYPHSVWEDQVSRVSALPRTSEERRVFQRWVFGGASEVSLDSLGRILLPDHLRVYAELHDQAILIGANDAIDIWSPERHEAVMTADLDRMPAILKRLSDDRAV